MFSRIPRSCLWSAGGAIVSLLAPLGLGLMHANLGPGFDWSRVGTSLAAERHTYTFVTIAAITSMTALGWLFGRQADRALAEARHDPLTGLLNRRAFEERLDTEFARSHRSGHPISLLLVDLDDLKAINDRFGHEAGDAALLRVAETLATGVRSTDALGARVGGDEFVVLAPETSQRAALALAHRLRESLAAASREHSPAVTVSVGVVTLDLVRHTTSASFFAAADSALYEAKRGGRDRIATG